MCALQIESQTFHQQKDYNSLYYSGLEPNPQYLQGYDSRKNYIQAPIDTTTWGIWGGGHASKKNS